MSDHWSRRTRIEHIVWCKERALELLDQGDQQGAVASMISDLGKHEGTRPAAQLAPLGIYALLTGDPREVRRFIKGFN